VAATSGIATRVDLHRATTLSKRVLTGDGAIGTRLQAADLKLDDFNDLEG
jgi:5-methyltetrahydrofolate--homocysteine methyltransferase